MGYVSVQSVNYKIVQFVIVLANACDVLVSVWSCLLIFAGRCKFWRLPRFDRCVEHSVESNI